MSFLGIGNNKKSSGQGVANVAGAVIGAGGGLLSMIGQKKREERANRNTRNMMMLQKANQMDLNTQGQQLAMKTWEDTNYSAQVDQLNKAHLNPALLYGQGGAGGSTAGGSGGSAASGSAAQPQPMEIGQMVNAAKVAAELGLMKAQTKKIEAEARKENVEANLREYGEQYGKDEYNLKSQQLSSDEQALWAEVKAKEMYVGEDNGWDMIAKNEVKNSNSQAEREMNEAILSKVKIEAEKANIKLTDERRAAIWHEIRQKWTAAGFKGLDSIVNGVFKTGVLKQAAKGIK